MKQAEALGKSLASTRFTAIHTSDLQRTMMTAEAIHKYQGDPQPVVTPSELLREQHFGVGEGKSYRQSRQPGLSLEAHFANGMFPALHSRTERFPEGESLDDLAERAKKAIEEILLPYVWEAGSGGESAVHVAVTSHGLFIREIIKTFLGMDRAGRHVYPEGTGGLRNTAWARIVVETETSGPDTSTEQAPSLSVVLTEFNRREHLESVVRQKGGIGSLAHDPKQKDIRAFFGGGGKT